MSRPAGKKGLDRQQVLEAARALGSTGELSIKALAQRLGIQPPSVYAHFPGGLADLRRGLALWGHRALLECLQAAQAGRVGADALFELGRAYLDFIRREPGLYAATVATPDQDDVELRPVADACLAVFYGQLHGLGLPPDQAVHALRGIRSIVHGFGQLEVNGAFRAALDRDVSFAQVLRTFVAAVAQQGTGGGEDPALPPTLAAVYRSFDAG